MHFLTGASVAISKNTYPTNAKLDPYSDTRLKKSAPRRAPPRGKPKQEENESNYHNKLYVMKTLQSMVDITTTVSSISIYL